ncbi:MAG: deoxyribose-phosphate aldolase [candidate division Zixibacteria bacterium]
MIDLARFFDHTLLKSDATENDIRNLCHEAVKFNFYSVVVNPVRVSVAVEEIKNSNVKIGAVSGFPLGTNTTHIKKVEALRAELDGADEIDVVANLGWFKSGDFTAVENELTEIRKSLANSTILKVIIETPILNADIWLDACRAVINSGADFIKSATGFAGPTPVEHIRKLKEICRDQIHIKAAGGIKSAETAREMIIAGASRIGCSSSVEIMNQIST